MSTYGTGWSAKDWRNEAIRMFALAKSEEDAGLNLDAELHYRRAEAAAAISTAISVAKPTPRNTGPK